MLWNKCISHHNTSRKITESFSVNIQFSNLPKSYIIDISEYHHYWLLLQDGLPCEILHL